MRGFLILVFRAHPRAVFPDHEGDASSWVKHTAPDCGAPVSALAPRIQPPEAECDLFGMAWHSDAIGFRDRARELGDGLPVEKRYAA